MSEAIITIVILIVLSGCQGNRFGYYNEKCDIKGVEKLCK